MASTQPSLNRYFRTIKKKPLRKGALIKSNDLSNHILVDENKNVDTFERENLKVKTFVNKVCERKTVNNEKNINVKCGKNLKLINFENLPTKSSNTANYLKKTPTYKTSNDTPLQRKRKRCKMEEETEELDLLTKGVTPPKKALEDKKIQHSKQKVIKKVEMLETDKSKLKPAEIREKLGKCGRLDELRAKLLKLNECDRKLEAFRSKKWNKEELKSPLKLSPSKSPLNLKRHPDGTLNKNKKESAGKKFSFAVEVPVSLSPRKTPSKILPSTLSPAKSKTSELFLPYTYLMLKEVFNSVDTVVSILHNRQEITTFSKLKPAVQQMIKKTFSTHYLGRIKTVFPLAYFFSQEKNKSYLTGKSNYELVVKPNFDYKRSKSVRNLSVEFGIEEKKSISGYRKMNSVVIVERRDIFHSSLLDILKVRHAEFLASLDPPIALDSTVIRWHPDFPIDDIEEPEAALLPLPPIEETIDSAAQILDKTREALSVNDRMKAALELSKNKSSEVLRTEKASKNDGGEKVQQGSQTKNEVCLALRGISLSLLEKIRARENAKSAREITRSVPASNELQMLSRLPEYIRIVRGLFVCEKKNALPYQTVLSNVVSSHSSSLSTQEAEEHLDLLMKQMPSLIAKHKVRSGLFLKIDKNVSLQSSIDTINDIIKQKT